MVQRQFPNPKELAELMRFKTPTLNPTDRRLEKALTIWDLREIAKGIDHEAVKGYTQMNKDHLLPALCKALGIEYHKHPHHEAVGIDKPKLKAWWGACSQTAAMKGTEPQFG